MSGILQAVFQNQRSFGAPPGQQAYTTAGTYSWVAPAGVTSVSVVVVGAGISGGGKGGALSYKNNYTVVPANSYTVVVASNNCSFRSKFVSCATVSASNGACRTGCGGGNGGTGSGGGGGAGGYSGNGGNGGTIYVSASYGASGSGGGGGGGGSAYVGFNQRSGGGGGVGILGFTGVSGSGGCAPTGQGGGGGSGGQNGFTSAQIYSGAAGGIYGGGGGQGCNCVGCSFPGTGKQGAVRIIWPGTTRSFPSTCTGNL